MHRFRKIDQIRSPHLPSGGGAPHRMTHQRAALRSERGVALLLVVFLVALATILVVNLAYMTSLSGRRNSIMQRGFQAEYLLKSTINFASVLLQQDTTPNVDSDRDIWGPFIQGQPVDPALLGIREPNIRIELQISPEDRKLFLNRIFQTTPDQKYTDAFVAFFRELGFDQDNQSDPAGPFSGRVFTPEELAANLIDYMDPDRDQPAIVGAFSGVESSSTEDLFPNEPIRWVSELATIPGFTAARMARIYPYVTTSSQVKLQVVNLNVAPVTVLQALLQGADPTLTRDTARQLAEQITVERQGQAGPFEKVPDLTTRLNIPATTVSGLQSMVSVRSKIFEVIGKVTYSSGSFFARALIEKRTGDPPEIRSLELF